MQQQGLLSHSLLKLYSLTSDKKRNINDLQTVNIDRTSNFQVETENKTKKPLSQSVGLNKITNLPKYICNNTREGGSPVYGCPYPTAKAFCQAIPRTA
jgi:hypothetical protein